MKNHVQKEEKMTMYCLNYTKKKKKTDINERVPNYFLKNKNFLCT